MFVTLQNLKNFQSMLVGHVCLFFCLFVCLFVCLFFCLFVCLFVCLYVCIRSTGRNSYPIELNFFLVIGTGDGTNPIDFGENPDPNPDPVKVCNFGRSLQVAILIQSS